MPARGAHLTGVPEVHLDHVPGGLFRFAPEDLDELGRARLVGESAEPGLGLLPVREEAAGLSGSGTGFTRRTMVPIERLSCRRGHSP